MAKLRREIREMKTARTVKRQQRQSGSVPTVAIAGYTNAGKSSLINALTGSGVLVQNALFATLDPTSRRTELPPAADGSGGGREIVLTDTVGFVRHLPTQLVEAFRSTLEEVAEADLIVHVVDGSDPIPTRQISAVRTVIEGVFAEAGIAAADAPPELLVINKIDAADPTVLAQLRGLFDGAVFVSAHTGEGIDELLDRIREAVGRADVELTVQIPFSRGDVVSRIHAQGDVLSTEHNADGTLMRVRVPADLAAQLTPLRVTD